MAKGISGRTLKTTPELEQAIAIVQSKEFTGENYQALLQLSEQSKDGRIGSMIEAFLAASPSLDFMDE